MASVVFSCLQTISLSKIGGPNMKRMVVAIINKVISKQVALNYSYLGKKGKRTFAALRLSAVILGKVMYTVHHTK